MSNEKQRTHAGREIGVDTNMSDEKQRTLPMLSYAIKNGLSTSSMSLQNNNGRIITITMIGTKNMSTNYVR
jgi:hypothetical protein